MILHHTQCNANYFHVYALQIPLRILFVGHSIDIYTKTIAAQHHRKLGFKSELGGLSRAKAGIMQRISMVALRATTRQVIRGVALVGAANVQAHSDWRAEKTAEAAKYDAFGPNHIGAFRPFDRGRTAYA